MAYAEKQTYTTEKFFDSKFISVTSSKQSIKEEIPTQSFYIHNKFCRIVNGMFYATTIDTENKKNYVYTILLFNDGSEEVSIKNDSLENMYQWNIALIKDGMIIRPKSIVLKDPNQKDMIIFGKRKVTFGTLYTVIFEENHDKKKIETDFKINKEKNYLQLYQYQNEAFIEIYN